MLLADALLLWKSGNERLQEMMNRKIKNAKNPLDTSAGRVQRMSVRRDTATETLKKFTDSPKGPRECGWSVDQRSPESGIPALGFFVVRATGDNGSAIKADRFLQLRVGGRDEKYGEDRELPGFSGHLLRFVLVRFFLTFGGGGFAFSFLASALQMRETNDKRRWYRQEYLKSEHWKSLRRQKLAINPTCEQCGASKRVEPHHLRYKPPKQVPLTRMLGTVPGWEAP